VFFGLLASSVIASPGMPLPYFYVPDRNPSYCLEVVPLYDNNDKIGEALQATVRCLSFTAEDKAEQRVLWQSDLLYPADVHLSSCGRFMVVYRTPYILLEKKKLKDWPIFEFYIEGKSIRKKILSDLGVDFERLAQPVFDTSVFDVVTDMRIIDTTDDDYPSDDELKLYDEDLFKPKEQLLYISVHPRVYFFRLTNGELVFKKLVVKDKE
jgi:hypothetical protein